MIDAITWFDHASFLLRGERTVYIDPWEIPGGPVADLVLVSHSHYDHLSLPDIQKVAGPETVVLASPDCAAKLPGLRVLPLAPGEVATVAGLRVEGVAAYNLNKKFHPRAQNWLGFVLTFGGERIYYAGDTDATPELMQVQADGVLAPVGGTYTMDAAEAAAAVDQIRPKWAVPYHWGKIVGGRDDAELFAALCHCPVTRLPKTRG